MSEAMPKCAECGFITMRNLYTGQLEDLDSDFRDTGNPPKRKTAAVGGAGMRFAEFDTTPYRHVPICFVQSVDLTADWPASQELLDRYKDWPASTMLEVITKERPECEGKFTPWQRGLTPKEHREMLDRQWMIRHEEEVRKTVWEREDRRDARAEDHHKEQSAEIRGQHKTELIVFGVLVTLAIVVSTVAGAMIEAGWISQPW